MNNLLQKGYKCITKKKFAVEKEKKTIKENKKTNKKEEL